MNLIHCIYASTATPRLPESDLPALLERARTSNALLSVTGMLLFIESSFFQVLEGEADVVDALYAKIQRDPRHERVTQIIRERIAHRSFSEWSMGFTSVRRDEVAQLVGANDFFEGASCLERIDAGRAKKLLVAFGAGRWRTEHTGLHRAHVQVA